jgi:hypothetical protein
VDTKIALGKLCVAFSDFFESGGPFVLKEFEINTLRLRRRWAIPPS